MGGGVDLVRATTGTRGTGSAKIGSRVAGTALGGGGPAAESAADVCLARAAASRASCARGISTRGAASGLTFHGFELVLVAFCGAGVPAGGTFGGPACTAIPYRSSPQALVAWISAERPRDGPGDQPDFGAGV